MKTLTTKQMLAVCSVFAMLLGESHAQVINQKHRKEPTATHCQPFERTIFSCQLNNHKVVSLCASPNLSSVEGTLQYRYGRLGRTPELSYPAPPTHPRTAFRFYGGEPGYTPGSYGGPLKALTFKQRSYTYTLEVFKNRGTFEAEATLKVSSDSAGALSETTCQLDRATDHFYQLEEFGIPRQELESLGYIYSTPR